MLDNTCYIRSTHRFPIWNLSCWYMAAFSQYRFQLSNTLLLISFPRNFQHHPQAYPWTSTPKLPRFWGKFLDTFWFVEILHPLRTGECESPFIQLGFQKVSTGYIISSPAIPKRTSIFFQPKNDHQKKHLKKRWPASNNAIVGIYSSNFWGVNWVVPFFAHFFLNKKNHATRPLTLGFQILNIISPGVFGLTILEVLRQEFDGEKPVEIRDFVITWWSFSSSEKVGSSKWWRKSIQEKNICFVFKQSVWVSTKQVAFQNWSM